MRQIALFILIFIALIWVVEANSGDIIGNYNLWTNEVKQMTIDSNNNLYIISSTWWSSTLLIYESFSKNDFMTNFYTFVNANNGKWAFIVIEYVLILLFPFILIILSLIYGLLYGFNFYKPGK